MTNPANEPLPEDEAAVDKTASENIGAEAADEAVNSPAGEASAARIAALEAQLAEAKDQMLRAVAEAENTRKRLLREREDVRKYAVADFARDLLEFADNFRRALAAIPAGASDDPLVKNIIDGVSVMDKELSRTLEKHGIRKIEPVGQPFDPNFHEALYEAPGTGQPAGTVIDMVEPGYVLHDRLLRPARVGIARKDDGAPTAGSQIDTQA